MLQMSALHWKEKIKKKNKKKKSLEKTKKSQKEGAWFSEPYQGLLHGW